MSDISQQLQSQINEAIDKRTALRIRGGGSKDFLGHESHGETLSTLNHRSVIEYEPTELVITARAGTPLNDIEAILADHHQSLPFEPPHFGPHATLGGTIACNLSGPARAFTGAARDFVLGIRMINGKGEILQFGGQVMKNVAGYDASRLMAGAMGTLGVILDISLKVLPAPEAEISLRKTLSEEKALQAMNRWSSRYLPMTAACYDGEAMTLRLAGSENAVKAASTLVGGDTVKDSTQFWKKLREQEHGFFRPGAPLWRISVPPATPPLALPGNWFYDWAGALRWLHSDAPAEKIQKLAHQHGGHATLYRGADNHAGFQPLAPALLAVHQRLKKAFDPHGLFNPGRLYPEL